MSSNNYNFYNDYPSTSDMNKRQVSKAADVIFIRMENSSCCLHAIRLMVL